MAGGRDGQGRRRRRWHSSKVPVEAWHRNARRRPCAFVDACATGAGEQGGSLCLLPGLQDVPGEGSLAHFTSKRCNRMLPGRVPPVASLQLLHILFALSAVVKTAEI